VQYVQYYACEASSGALLPGAIVAVEDSAGDLATLYDANEIAIGNPLTASSSGKFGFAADDGDYSVLVEAGGVQQPPLTVYLIDPASAAENTSSAQAAASAAATAVNDAVSDANTTALALLTLALSHAKVAAAGASNTSTTASQGTLNTETGQFKLDTTNLALPGGGTLGESIEQFSTRTQGYLDPGTNSTTGNATLTLASDGVTGIIELVADVLSLANNTGGGSPLQALLVAAGKVIVVNQLYVGSTVVIDPTTGTIQFNLTSVSIAVGGPFGASSNLAFWIGPSMALSAMTKTNGTFWIDSAGDAYFGGSLSAGTLTTKAATSDTSTSAVAETAVFGSNGGTITVTVSYAYSSITTTTYPGTSAGLSGFNSAKAAVSPAPALNGAGDYVSGPNADPSASTVVLYRSIGGSALTAVATLSATGSWTWTGTAPIPADSSPGTVIQGDAIGGSITFTDPDHISGTPGNRQYQAVLTSRGAEYTGGVTQNISIICVE
jgi:hypothetical protein